MSATGGTRSDRLEVRRSMLRACYEGGLASEPSMNGTVSFRLEISAALFAERPPIHVLGRIALTPLGK